MTDKKNGSTFLGDGSHFTYAFVLKRCIPYGKHLIHDQNLRFQVCRHCERESQIHPGGVALDWSIDELLHFRESDDLVELPGNLRLSHAQDGAVQVDVLPSAQLAVKTGADFQQRADPPMDLSKAIGRLGDARKNFQ